MGEHMAYWNSLLQAGQAVVFGPVADPKGSWGLGILEAGSETEARAIVDADPVSRANAGFSYEIYSMPMTVFRGAPATA